jgi:hypothetical protein
MITWGGKLGRPENGRPYEVLLMPPYEFLFILME